MTETGTATDTSGGRGRLVLLAVVLAAIVAGLVWLPTGEWLDAALDWIDRIGVWGPVAFVGIYIAACVLLLPGSVLTLGAGVLFGVVEGSAVVSVAATLGAGAAFLVGRYLARDWVAGKVSTNARFGAIDEAVGKQGFKIVLLTRLSPVFPFNLLNYAYGLTGVPFRHYFLASWLGMIPGTVMYVYLGYAGREAAAAGAEGGKTAGEWVLLGVGLAATVAVTVFVTKIARRALDEAVALDGAETAA